MAERETCPGCGFDWDATDPASVAPAVRAAADAFADLIAGAPDRAQRRVEPERWSAFEYGAHLRDVLLNIRDRLFVGLAEDGGLTRPMFRELRIPFYAGESIDTLPGELRVAADLLARTFERLSPDDLARTIGYGVPEPLRTLAWVGAQARHEAEHHLDDARRNLA